MLFLGMDFTELINIKWYDNTSVSIIDYEDGKFDVVAEGDISFGKRALHVLNQEWWNEYNEK